MPLAATDPISAVLQLGPLLLAAVLYFRRASTLTTLRQPVPRWRQACFYGGLAIVAGALGLLGSGSQELLAIHMVEHLLIGDIAALLLVLGLTGPLIAPVLRIGLFNRLRVLSNPAIALPLWVVDLYVWHLPFLYQAALRNGGVHALEHIMFLLCGANLWMCLFGPLPTPAWFQGGIKALYVLAYWFAGTLLANTLIWVGTVFYPFYESGDAAVHISPLTDQQLAGGIMMIEGSVVTLCVGGWLLMTALREAGERQELVEFARARGVELSSERAARAVRAGRASELRSRLDGSPAVAPSSAAELGPS
ncbi:MAG: cytochrome c oxidase assembly protein [Solirubrobacteraceae bacterium]